MGGVSLKNKLHPTVGLSFLIICWGIFIFKKIVAITQFMKGAHGMFISPEEQKQKSLIKLSPTVKWFGGVIVGGIFIGTFFPKRF